MGDTFSIADAACYHPVWFAKNSPVLAAAIAARPSLSAWCARIEGFGPGDVRPMTAAEALAVARASEPADLGGGEPAGADGLAPGDAVAIRADDYGPEEIRGTVVRVSAEDHDPS